jgi:hypothetical protein
LLIYSISYPNDSLDDVAWVWWFDRQGAIQSTGINFIQDLPYFVVLLVAFQRFNLANWGIMEQWKPDETSDTPFFLVEFPNAQLSVMANAKADIYRRYSLTGRCTHVYNATGAFDKDLKSISTHPELGEQLAGMLLALKVYWPEESRPNEADVLQTAFELAKIHPFLTDHLPELLASYDHIYSTGMVRNRLGIPASVKGIRTSRALRFLLFKELQPLDPKMPINDFMNGWKHCLTCEPI